MLHLYIHSPCRLHLCIHSPCRLHLYIHTPCRLHLCIHSPCRLHLYIYSPCRLHLYILSPCRLHLYIHSSCRAHLYIYSHFRIQLYIHSTCRPHALIYSFSNCCIYSLFMLMSLYILPILICIHSKQSLCTCSLKKFAPLDAICTNNTKVIWAVIIYSCWGPLQEIIHAGGPYRKLTAKLLHSLSLFSPLLERKMVFPRQKTVHVVVSKSR